MASSDVGTEASDEASARRVLKRLREQVKRQNTALGALRLELHETRVLAEAAKSVRTRDVETLRHKDDQVASRDTIIASLRTKLHELEAALRRSDARSEKLAEQARSMRRQVRN